MLGRVPWGIAQILLFDAPIPEHLTSWQAPLPASPNPTAMPAPFDEIAACPATESLEAVFLIADISGYTRFMMENRVQAVHATLIVQRLLESIMKQLRAPFAVEEVEGDALFCAATREASEDGAALSSTPSDWRALGDGVWCMCVSLMEAFETQRDSLVASNPCGCNSCKSIGRLRLKIVVHVGTAARYSVGAHRKLSGVDVIVVHRLLKNSVKGDEYVLFTRKAFEALGLTGTIEVEPGGETLEGVGPMEIRVQKRVRQGNPAPVVRASIFILLQEGMLRLRAELRHLMGKLALVEFDEA